jgi:hypothetical protein
MMEAVLPSNTSSVSMKGIFMKMYEIVSALDGSGEICRPTQSLHPHRGGEVRRQTSGGLHGRRRYSGGKEKANPVPEWSGTGSSSPCPCHCTDWATPALNRQYTLFRRRANDCSVLQLHVGSVQTFHRDTSGSTTDRVRVILLSSRLSMSLYCVTNVYLWSTHVATAASGKCVLMQSGLKRCSGTKKSCEGTRLTRPLHCVAKEECEWRMYWHYEIS